MFPFIRLGKRVINMAQVVYMVESEPFGSGNPSVEVTYNIGDGRSENFYDQEAKGLIAWMSAFHDHTAK